MKELNIFPNTGWNESELWYNIQGFCRFFMMENVKLLKTLRLNKEHLSNKLEGAQY